jgi:hypothetical protein
MPQHAASAAQHDIAALATWPGAAAYAADALISKVAVRMIFFIFVSMN